MNKELSVAMESCLVFSARYAHARNRASVHVIDAILECWDSLTDRTKDQLKREAKNEAIYNLDDWQKIIDR